MLSERRPSSCRMSPSDGPLSRPIVRCRRLRRRSGDDCALVTLVEEIPGERREHAGVVGVRAESCRCFDTARSTPVVGPRLGASPGRSGRLPRPRPPGDSRDHQTRNASIVFLVGARASRSILWTSEANAELERSSRRPLVCDLQRGCRDPGHPVSRFERDLRTAAASACPYRCGLCSLQSRHGYESPAKAARRIDVDIQRAKAGTPLAVTSYAALPEGAVVIHPSDRKAS